MPTRNPTQPTNRKSTRVRGMVTLVFALFAVAATPATAHDWNSRDRHDGRDDDRYVVVRPGPGHHAHGARHHRPVPVYVNRSNYRYAYRHGHRDPRIHTWFSFSAISLPLLAVLSTRQQADFESAHARATTAPIGQRIVWQDRSASGSVVATREGSDRDGRYCREFQRTVTIGGRTEDAYGTACQQPDGAWEIVSSGD